MNASEDNVDKLNGELDRNMLEANDLTESQVAHYVVDLLDDHAQHLTAVTAKRLSDARGLALRQLARQQIANHSGVLAWFGDRVEHHRTMTTAVVVAAMLLAFYAAQHFRSNTNLENSDAFLLASDLPPEAYADKGFDTWLVSKTD